MKHKVLKKFYCPLNQRRVEVGELIEIPEANLDSYLPYIEKPEIKVEEKIEIKVIEPVEKAIKKKVK